MIRKTVIKLRNSSLFYKYLISYAFLLILPVFITGFVVYQFVVSVMHTQVLQSNKGMLEQIRDTMDHQLGEMRAIAVQISSKRDFDQELLQDPYFIYEAKKKIQLYSEANAFFFDIVYKAHGQPILISSESTYLLSNFYDYYFRGKLDYKQYEHMISSNTHETVVIGSTVSSDNMDYKERSIVYAVPVRTFGSSYEFKGTLLFFIKEQQVKKLLNSFLPYKQSNVYVLDQEGNLITSLLDTRRMPEELLLDRTELNEIIQLNGESYYVSQITSSSTGWSYITVVSEEQLMKPVDEINVKAAIALVLILVFGSVIIYINMHVHYHPLRKIVTFVDARLQDSEGSSKRGLEKLHSALQTMSHWIDLSRPALGQHLLTKLLQGQVEDWEEFHEKSRSTGIHLTDAQYRVVCMQAYPESEDTLAADVDLIWRSIVSDHGTLYRIDTIDPNHWVWLQSFETEREEQWSEWHKRLTEQTNVSWTIGVGDAFGDLSMLPRSYIGALTALQYHLILGRDRVILPEHMRMDFVKYSWHPTRELEMLVFHMKEHDIDNVDRSVEGILELTRSRCSSLLSAKYIYLELLNTLVRSVVQKATEQGVTIAYPNLIKLTQCTSYQQMDSIVQATLQLIRPVLVNGSNSENVLLKKMIKLLQARYHDPQFSIQGLTTHFPHSLSYLTRFFKENTGRTVSEYLHGIRLDEAKRLLAETDLTITEIVQEIGYTDPSSFSRKFKAEVKLTPGEFRKRMQERRYDLDQ